MPNDLRGDEEHQPIRREPVAELSGRYPAGTPIGAELEPLHGSSVGSALCCALGLGFDSEPGFAERLNGPIAATKAPGIGTAMTTGEGSVIAASSPVWV